MVAVTTRCDDYLARAREAEMAALSTWLDRMAQAVIGPVPEAERLTWDAKEAAAMAVLAETASDADLALLDQERALTGETREDLAGLIVARAAIFRAVGPHIAGTRRAAGEAIASATTVEAVKTARQAGEAAFSAWLTAAGAL